MAVANFIFGIAIFLFAMRELEAGVRLASGAKIKEWVIRSTNTSISSAACGVVVTAILQSSSMVSLLVLALVSAGVMPLFNGVGVVLGANLGTTMTGWIVTVIGFKMDLLALIVPLLGVGAFCQLKQSGNEKWSALGKALVGLGLLIFGLDLMKSSVSGLANYVDFAAFANASSWFYLLVGLFLAAVMQSSSAVMIITLSLLSSELIPLSQAAAIVIGADLGTTSTTILGSLGESRVKKQLAFAHVFFNISVDMAAFFIFLPLFPAMLASLSITDSLFGLVFFHSSFNLLGVLLFLPFLKMYTHWIQWLMPLKNQAKHRFLDVPIEVIDVAIGSLGAALTELTKHAFQLNLGELNIEILTPAKLSASTKLNEKDFLQSYLELKEFETEMIAYANRIVGQGITVEQANEVRRCLETARSLVYATKTLKDVYADLKYLHSLDNDPSTLSFISQHEHFLRQFFNQVLPLLLPQGITEPIDTSSKVVEELGALNDLHRRESNDLIAKFNHNDKTSTAHLSTLMNLSQEIHHYSRSILNAVTLQTAATV